MTAAGHIDVLRVPAGGPVAAPLLAGVTAELRELYGDDVLDRTPTAGPAELGPPGGGYLVVRVDGRAVAGGGYKRMEDGMAEIKRMFVVPEARRRGHARRLLVALEEACREHGYARVRLDTGARQPHAQALYESAGYRSIPDYNGNQVASYWAEKTLASATGRPGRRRR